MDYKKNRSISSTATALVKLELYCSSGDVGNIYCRKKKLEAQANQFENKSITSLDFKKRSFSGNNLAPQPVSNRINLYFAHWRATQTFV